jgi:hypothetical protein
MRLFIFLKRNGFSKQSSFKILNLITFYNKIDYFSENPFDLELPKAFYKLNLR